jgi:ABC-type sugar transport system permease subunit
MERSRQERDSGAPAATARPPAVPAPGRGTPSPGVAHPAPPGPPARRPTRQARWRRHWGVAVWMLPAALVMALVFGYSVVELYVQAVTNQGSWAGLANVRLVLSDPYFRAAIEHNLQLLIAVPVLAALGLFLAILVYEGLRGWRAYRFMIFLPYILPVPVIAVVFSQLLQQNGALNEILGKLGLGVLAANWLGDPNVSLWAMMGVIIWREAGFAFVLFLARLLSLPQETQEAARIDGAGFFSLHWRITIPQLRSVIWFYAVIEGITMISWVFNYVYIMSNGQGGPGDSTMVTELYIYQNAFQFNAPQLAAAAAALLFTVLVVVFAIGLGVRALVLWRRSRSQDAERSLRLTPAARPGGEAVWPG